MKLSREEYQALESTVGPEFINAGTGHHGYLQPGMGK